MMFDKISYFGVCCLLLPFATSETTNFTHDETVLYRHLFGDYEKLVRPVKNHSDAVEVKHGISLQSLLSLENDLLTAFVWENYEWNDFRLSWDPNEYGGIQSIRAPTSKVWMPDIQMYNSLIDTRRAADTQVVVYSDGTLNCVPPLHVSSLCAMNMRHFPRDEQHCPLKFGSWTYDGSKVNLTIKHTFIDTSPYQNNGEWLLVNDSVARNVQRYDCCPEPYIDVTYEVHLRRRDHFYNYVMISPVMLLLLMTPFIFLTNPKSHLKITFGVGLLISGFVALKMICDFIPLIPYALPIVVKFYVCSLTLISLSLVLSMVVSHVAGKGIHGNHPPEFLRKIFLDWLGTLCCVKKDAYMLHRSSMSESGVPADDVTLTKPQAEGHVSDWFLIAAVIDKMLLVLFGIVCVVCLVGFHSA